MVEIIFEAHSTTFDNEKHRASGWNDVDLSPLGRLQAEDLGRRYRDQSFDAIFTSDLKRAYSTAEIAFAGRLFPLVRDSRLRECDYGDLTQSPASEVDPIKAEHIDRPFPNGESYIQAFYRVNAFLDELSANHRGKKIMIIGHRATQYGLECRIKGVPLKEAVFMPWAWQPGWIYLMP